MNEVQNLITLRDELITALEIILSSGEELSDELQGMIAQELEWLTNRIDELSNETPADGLSPTRAPTVPELEPGPFPSSNINSFKYNPDDGELFIKFHGKDTANSGPTYRYEGVPQNIYNVFRRGAVGPRTSGKNKYHTWHRNILPSLGAAAYQLIREGGYPYQRIA